MARELAEVLHYFLDDAEPAPPPAARGVVALPLEPDETLRAGFVAELAARLAEGGAGVAVCGPRELLALLPSPAPGVTVEPEPVGTGRSGLRGEPGPGAPGWRLELVRADREPPPSSPAWSLLFATPDPEDLALARRRVGAILRRAPGARVGVTLHGVRDLAEAEPTFLRLAAAVEADGAERLLSYGAILDELEVLRALVAGRGARGLAPGSRARRSFEGVAALLTEDLSAAPPE